MPPPERALSCPRSGQPLTPPVDEPAGQNHLDLSFGQAVPDGDGVLPLDLQADVLAARETSPQVTEANDVILFEPPVVFRRGEEKG